MIEAKVKTFLEVWENGKMGELSKRISRAEDINYQNRV